MDNYNDGSKVIDSNFDDPRLTDYDLLLQNIRDLKNGKNIQVQRFAILQIALCCLNPDANLWL